MDCTFVRSFNEHPNRLSLCTLICNTFIEGPPNFLQNIFLCCWNDLPPFYRHNSSCTVFWVSSFHLSVNIVVLYQFMVTRIEKVEAWGLSDGKKFKIAITSMFSGREDVPQKKGMDLWNQISSSKCSFTCICGIFFALKPFHDYSFNMLGLHFTPVCVLLLVCSLHFTHSLHFTPGPQSAVRSPQSAFYTDRLTE